MKTNIRSFPWKEALLTDKTKSKPKYERVQVYSLHVRIKSSKWNKSTSTYGIQRQLWPGSSLIYPFWRVKHINVNVILQSGLHQKVSCWYFWPLEISLEGGENTQHWLHRITQGATSQNSKISEKISCKLGMVKMEKGITFYLFAKEETHTHPFLVGYCSLRPV